MRNYTVTEIWEIPIRLNVSLVIFLPILAWLIGSGEQIPLYAGFIDGLVGIQFDVDALRAGSNPWVIGVLAAVGLFLSVTIHELGHSWVAIRYGIGIESITLWILGGIASFTSLPREWNREFWIAIAGPLTSFGVAVVCLAGAFVLPQSVPIPRFVLGWLGITNIVLAVFNLLPAFPMDGGRILRSLLARSQPYGTATRTAARIGVGFAFLFAAVGVLTLQLLLVLLALFIYGAATTESRSVLLHELLQGITVGDLMSRNPRTVAESMTIAEFGQTMLADRRTSYPVVNDRGDVTGVVRLEDLRSVPQQQRAERTVGSVAKDVPRVPPDGDAFEVLARIGQTGTPLALVLENGVLVGLLTDADYAHALAIRGEFAGTGGY